ncbi:MAG: PEP-utilizing enzyme [Verrucomicrobiales bacterium]
MEELKLETPTTADDASMLIGSILRGADQPEIARDARAPDPAEIQRRAEASLHPIRRAVFRWVLAQARSRVRERENLRFERTRIFGRVRRIMLEIGDRLAAANRLAEARDIFYLPIDDVLACESENADLKANAAAARDRFAGYADAAPPPDRFETRGDVTDRSRLIPRAAPPPASIGGGGDSAEARRGIGCCAGAARGRARVIRDPRGAQIAPGEILVAPQTDPGWVMLFPGAAGLVVERGSLLSHSAIVSRELGLPSVVAVAGACDWISTGELIEVDGAAGIVRKLSDQSDG